MFYSSAEQRSLFEAALARASKIWGNSIVTALEPAPEFYPAETYHQDFFAKNPNQGYCNAVVLPKMLKVRERFQSYLH
jgi:peptide-methionine (S)-S-oxide reductase